MYILIYQTDKLMQIQMNNNLQRGFDEVKDDEHAEHDLKCDYEGFERLRVKTDQIESAEG